MEQPDQTNNIKNNGINFGKKKILINASKMSRKFRNKKELSAKSMVKACEYSFKIYCLLIQVLIITIKRKCSTAKGMLERLRWLQEDLFHEIKSVAEKGLPRLLQEWGPWSHEGQLHGHLFLV